MKIFGTFLIVLGLLWAFGGVYNSCSHFNSLTQSKVSSEFVAWSILINSVVFIGPGLTLGGIGALIRKK